LKREKPCAGGLSWRVIKEFKEFVEGIPQYPIKNVLYNFEGETFEINFSHNVGVVTDRFAFDKNLRRVASREGAKVINKSVEPKNLKDDFIIDARGCGKCNNPAIAIRCDAKKKNQKMYFEFKRKIIKTGYFWIFPISDTLVNVGVGGFISDFAMKPMESLNWFLKKMELKSSNLSAAPICLDGKIENLLDDNIIKVGERGGLVNPVTSEGIYYAMKSSEIAADCIIKDEVFKYEKLIKKRFGKEFKISNLTRDLISKSSIPIARYVFKLGINHTKSRIEEGFLNLI
jgi:flavin-dependent dehydrogenase